MSRVIEYRVPARSWPQIGRIADGWRSALGCSQVPFLPIVEIMEGVLANRHDSFEWHIGTQAEMGDAEGQTCPRGTFIRIREDVYDAACAGQSRARFTLAHEFGHYVLHTDLPLERASLQDHAKPYCLAEPQANQFAGRFLVPNNLLRRTDTIAEIMRRFGVSRSTAEIRLTSFRKEIIQE